MSEENSYILIAKLDNVRMISNILRSINFKETATVFMSENGLKITVEDSKCVQANAFLQSALFQEYIISEEEAAFRINLTVVIECLSIFGTSPTPGIMTALELRYSANGEPLILLLEENGVVTDCSIKTMDAAEVLDFNFCSGNVVNKIIMKSDCLKELFAELDTTSDYLEIHMSPDKPNLRISTVGNCGSMQSDFQKESEMIESFQCTKTQINRYKMALLKPSIKALMLSSRISMRTDSRGFLSLQYMVKAEDNHTCFIEYFCCPDEDTEA